MKPPASTLIKLRLLSAVSCTSAEGVTPGWTQMVTLCSLGQQLIKREMSNMPRPVAARWRGSLLQWS
jgi:hypothetical protein